MQIEKFIEFQKRSIDLYFFTAKLSTCMLWKKYERSSWETLKTRNLKHEKNNAYFRRVAPTSMEREI